MFEDTNQDDDDNNNRDDRGKAPMQAAKRRRALPDEFAVLPREVRIQLLSKLQPADLEPFCRSSATYQLIYCGVESRDAPVDSLLDANIVYEHWELWLERDYGIHGDANRCRAYAGAERRWVAASMVRYVPPGSGNLEKLRKYRALYEFMQKQIGLNDRFMPLPNHYFWYYRDGIAVVSENGNDRRYRSLFEGGGNGRYIGLVSIVDVVRSVWSHGYDAQEAEYIAPVFILMRQTRDTNLMGVFGSDVHTGVYLVLEENTPPPGFFLQDIADHETAVVVTDDAVVLAQLTEEPFAFREMDRYQMFADPVGAPYSGFFSFRQPGGAKRVFEVSGDDEQNRALTPEERAAVAEYTLFVPLVRGAAREQEQLRPTSAGELDEFGILPAEPQFEGRHGYTERYSLALRHMRIRIGGPLRVRSRFTDEEDEPFNEMEIVARDLVAAFYKYKVEVRDADGEWQTRCFTISEPLLSAGEPILIDVRVFFVPVVRRLTANQAARFDCRIVAVSRAPRSAYSQLELRRADIRDRRARVRIDTLYIERVRDTPRVLLQYSNVRLPPDFNMGEGRVLGVIDERTVLFYLGGAYRTMTRPPAVATEVPAMYRDRVEVLAAFDVLNGEYRELEIDRMSQYYMIRDPSRPFMRLTVLDNDLASLRANRFLQLMREYNQPYGRRVPAIVNGPRECDENVMLQYSDKWDWFRY